MNGYIALLNGKKIEIFAETSYSAQKKALEIFQKNCRKKINGYEITVILCEIKGADVIHSADF